MIRIIQCLCPSRHAIMALAYVPGITGAQKEFGGTEDITLDESNAVEYMRSIVEGLIERHVINPWCGLCMSRVFSYEDALTRFKTIEEAEPILRQLEAEQLEIKRSFGSQPRNAPEKN
jgi:hypothetical protein